MVGYHVERIYERAFARIYRTKSKYNRVQDNADKTEKSSKCKRSEIRLPRLRSERSGDKSGERSVW